ncbi:MAG: tRNA uridine-5-carboxymethylaminomethyl(34) synthesis GTPase MnmE [Candidatus Cloacimonadota bacterium]|nr:MAG: tRNA uridine-5-carboxymethylaminomethyl(34) synthesis GTPase MnmE [Candidatus Cloacimonadota bacterium]
MIYKEDTVAAISTPKGKGGLHVLRISGKDAIANVDKIFKGKKKLSDTDSHNIVFGKIIDNGKLTDEVLCSVFRSPHSYTGEDTVEISCHGNYFIAGKILKALLKTCRLAEKGEFTRRAFFNNKIDLTKAEAIGDLLEAETEQAHSLAMEQLEGSLYKRIKIMLDHITRLRTLIELEIDFMEQGLDTLDFDDIIRQLQNIFNDMKSLSDSSDEGQIIREGLRVSLAGKPNVGKSSIFNLFLESERAIVTPIPGTTRDYLEEAVSIEGYLIRLFDTAGIRETCDHIEKTGIERSRDIVKKSHFILYITDSPEETDDFEELKKVVPENKIIKVLNKSDLFTEEQLNKFSEEGFVICSALSYEKLSDLKKRLLANIKITPQELKSGIISNARQAAAVEKSLEKLEQAINILQNNLGIEFAAFDLKEASQALEEIIGIISSEDLLRNIFDNFCIGK